MREYFNKLYNILYIIILVPLVLFTYLYLESQKVDLHRDTHMVGQSWIFFVIFLGGFFYSFWYFRTQIKRARTKDSLDEKLKQYKWIVIIRYLSTGLGCLMLTAGFWFSSHSMFIALFMMGMIAFSVWWPSPQTVCKNLLLKGEDREKVLHFRKAS